MRELIWRCADGRRLRVSQMEDSHLANCIRMINRGYDHAGRRVGPRTRAALPALLIEVEIRRQGLRR